MNNILDNLIERLNYLIGLLDISSEESFNKIRGHKIQKDFDSVGEVYKNQYKVYRNQITISAILLGYAYFEAYLTDLLRICISKNPQILIPNGKAQNKDKTITYQQLIQASSYDELIEKLVEKELQSIMYKPMQEILIFIEKKLKLKWNQSVNDDIIIANKLRNCIMHNNCIIDKGLAKFQGFTEGNEIVLSPSDVHRFGIEARQLSRELWNSAKMNYNL